MYNRNFLHWTMLSLFTSFFTHFCSSFTAKNIGAAGVEIVKEIILFLHFSQNYSIKELVKMLNQSFSEISNQTLTWKGCEHFLEE